MADILTTRTMMVRDSRVDLSAADFSACILVSPQAEPQPKRKAPIGQRGDELRDLVDALNAAPERIASGLTIADLRGIGVPADLLREIEVATGLGAPESAAVLAFLRRVAESADGDGLSAKVKRAIRAADRRGGAPVEPEVRRKRP